MRESKSSREVGYGRGVGDVVKTEHDLARRSRRLQGLPAAYSDNSPPPVRRVRRLAAKTRFRLATKTCCWPPSSPAPSTPETMVPTKLKPSQHWRRWRAGVFNVQDWLNNEACQVIELGCRGVASEVVKKEEEQVLKEEAKEEAKEEEQVAKEEAFEEDVNQQVKEFVEQDEEMLEEMLDEDMEYIDLLDPDCVAERLYSASCEDDVFLAMGCRICRIG